MGIPVVFGGKAMCSMGAGIFNLSAIGNVMIENKPVLTIKDNVVGVNVAPVGVVMCQAKTNPNVIAATAAAAGVPTPGPCAPIFPGPWFPGTINCRAKGMGLVDSSCSLMCAYGGKISVSLPGATFKVTVK